MFFMSFSQRFLWMLQFFLLVSGWCFRDILLNLDLFMMDLWSSYDMKRASLARIYFFIGTWGLSILKIMLLYMPKLSTSEVTIKIYQIWIWHKRHFYNHSRQMTLLSVFEIPFWMQLLPKDGSLKSLFQKHYCVGIDWTDLWV